MDSLPMPGARRPDGVSHAPHCNGKRLGESRGQAEAAQGPIRTAQATRNRGKEKGDRSRVAQVARKPAAWKRREENASTCRPQSTRRRLEHRGAKPTRAGNGDIVLIETSPL